MQSVKADLEYQYRYWIDFGVKRERERIIKLLDENLDFDYEDGIYDKESGCHINVDDLFALIKGENK